MSVANFVGSLPHYPGRRDTVSPNPEARDWLVVFHKKGKTTKKEMGEKQPMLLLGRTRTDAEREVWRAQNVRGNKEEGLYCELKVFSNGRWRPLEEVEDV
jgi:hypothetical protein